VREWAGQNPDLACTILEVPPIESLARPDHHPLRTGLTTLESYIKWRGWDINNVVASRAEFNAATSLVSHPLTFPLTLGAHLASFLRQRDVIDGHCSTTMKLCCVGARAEATLPTEYWREMLLYSSALAGASNNGSQGGWHWHLDFVGPDISSNLPAKTISLDTADESNCTKEIPWAPNRTLRLRFFKSYLHQYIMSQYKEAKTKCASSDDASGDELEEESSFDLTALLSLWDGFLLFNPGIGHPYLAKGWRPTLRYILTTGKPVIVTAHSQLDSERDWLVIKQTMSELEQGERLSKTIEEAGGDAEANPYQLNPFASRIEYEDPCCDSSDDNKKLVRPNMLVMRIPCNGLTKKEYASSTTEWGNQ